MQSKNFSIKIRSRRAKKLYFDLRFSKTLTDYGIKIEAHQTEHSDSNLLGHENGSIKSVDITKKKKDYQIAICQDGKFVVTFDTVSLRIKILQNTDYRPFYICEEKELDGTVEIDETIAYFEINNDFIIENENVYKPQGSELDINNSLAVLFSFIIKNIYL
ncbi:hypothetical protein GLOIN_2v1475226 [Rhizophagus irregularis DAOM 181602=DAOM 197198]|nr:hypothetical protein GLOIN_2v1475226 [Rhizophagus irregularis DAOM 181602=DAOM 197198]